MGLAARSEYAGLLTTGEDVGVPLALQARARGLQTPIYIITHGSFFGSPRFRWLMTILRRMTNVHYLCLSDTLRRTMIGRFGVQPSQVHNASYGVDTRFFQPIGARAEPAIVASAGTANRDYRTLVRAASALPLEVRIAADSAWFPATLDIRGDELPAHVEVRSFRDYPSLRGLYASARFVVVPLYPGQHACGYAVIAEAMAMGKAVIATRTASPSDFLVDGETGYYVRPEDPDDLQAKMLHLLENPGEAERMGQAARARMEALFTVEAYCQRIEDVTSLREGAKRPHRRQCAA
jgi:glycosyltransferase involved in cell wall biosynthesis